MKQLRVLTGRHAGVHLDLGARRYVIGAEDEADIQLTDWRFAPMVLYVKHDGMVSLAEARNKAKPDAARRFAQFHDFQPRRIGDVVLCVGPRGGEWPSDLDLIASITHSKPQPERPARSRPLRALPASIGAALMTLALGAAVARLHQGTQAPAEAPALSLKSRVESAIAKLPLAGLEVVSTGEGVLVRGLVDDPSESLALRERLSAFANETVIHAYAAVPEIEQTIVESLARPGLKAVHRGDGLFVINGQTTDKLTLMQAAERIARDMDPLVRRIDVVVAEVPPTGHAPLSAVMSLGDLQYVQTRDGVKHLSITSVDKTDALADPVPTAKTTQGLAP